MVKPTIIFKTSKKLSPSFLFFFQYPQNSHFFAHLYEHLLDKIFTKIENSPYLIGGVSAGILWILIRDNFNPKLLSDIFLLKTISLEDLYYEKKRIILEGLTNIYEHRLLIHNLIQYQKKDKRSLCEYFHSLEKLPVSKKEILKNLNLTHVIFINSRSLIFSYQREINNISANFLFKKLKYKNTSFENVRVFPQDGIIYLAYSLSIPIDSIVEAYKLVFISRVLREEIEKKLRENGLIYNCRLEMDKDFTSRIFSTFIFPIEAKNSKMVWEIAKKIIENPPKNEAFFKYIKKKLLEELAIKVKDFIEEERSKIEQQLEWNSFTPLSIREKIEIIKKINVEILYKWWNKKLPQVSCYSLLY
ncbi:MAG: hypothetical protein ACPLKP_00060 [Microgenomates group bacterium]